MHKFIFYFSYLAFPFLVFLIFLIFKRKIRKTAMIFVSVLIFLSLLFIYSRFIERNIIVVQETSIEVGFPAKIIVIADMHLGVYKNANFMKRVVQKINQIKNVDAILIPGDFTYYPEVDLNALFSSLKDLKVPVYAVLGNHDSEKPGPPIQKELQASLEESGVTFLHNSSALMKGKNINILGLGDNWAYEDETSQIDNFAELDNLIVVTHNPDTVLKYENSIPDLTVSGHTHGGQIRIPFVYKFVIPCSGDFDQGLYEKRFGKVFVTSGLGEVGLPMRLGIPPVIDILNLE